MKCIKVEFKDNDEVLRFIYAVNKHRKQVKTGAADLLLKLFPLDKYPLLYADLRGDITGGNTASQKRKIDLEKQRTLDDQAADLIGITPETLRKTKSTARKKAGLNKPKPAGKPTRTPAKVDAAILDAKARDYLDKHLAKFHGRDRVKAITHLIKHLNAALKREKLN